MGNGNFISKIFSAIKPYGREDGGKGVGVSEAQVVSYDTMANALYGSAKDKKALYLEYTDMSLYPEVADAIDEIVNEAISSDADNQVISMKILDPDMADNENIVMNLQKEFDYIVDSVLDFSTTADDLFRKFYIEGELYAEMKVDPTNPSQGIKGIQLLPSYTMNVEYDDNDNAEKYTQELSDVGYIRTDTTDSGNNSEISFDPSQIAYINSGLVNREKNLVYSYLERAKVAYRQLKWMENAVIIYRVTRAPDRRVFYIDVGKLPKNKADEHVKSLVNRYKNKKIYNPSTGEVDVGTDMNSMNEDFFFPVRGAEGSRVETLPGMSNTGGLEDVQYFLKKLYKSLKVPTSRIGAQTFTGDDEGGFGDVTATEITSDEINFSKYVTKIRNRFIDFVYQVFFTHLSLRGYDKKLEGIIDKKKVAIVYNESNPWKELKDLDLMAKRGEIFEGYAQHEGIFFSKNFLYKTIMNFTDEEIIQLNEELAEGGSVTGDEDDVDTLGGDESGEGEEEAEESISDPDIPLLLQKGQKVISDYPTNKIKVVKDEKEKV